MSSDDGIVEVAQLFKVLGNESRLRLLRLLAERPLTVGALSGLSGMSQPLVSQHLRMLRQTELVTANRQGKEMVYRIGDDHVTHVIEDAFIHVHEPPASSAESSTREETA